MVPEASLAVKERKGFPTTPTWAWVSKGSLELLDPEVQQVKPESLAEMAPLASRALPDLQ